MVSWTCAHFASLPGLHVFTKQTGDFTTSSTYTCFLLYIYIYIYIYIYVDLTADSQSKELLIFHAQRRKDL